MTNIVIVKQSLKNYLFSVPMGTTLKRGDKVVCDTARGEQEGVCFTNSFLVEADALNEIALLTGAILPLKSVVGKSEIVRFNKEKPQANKFEVGKRYKVNRYFYNEGGNVIEIIEEISGWYHYKTIVGTYKPDESVAIFAPDSPFANYLIPYNEKETTIESEKHTYKAGDYVKIISKKNHCFEIGYVVKLNYEVHNGWWNCTGISFDNEGFSSYAPEDEFKPFEWRVKI